MGRLTAYGTFHGNTMKYPGRTFYVAPSSEYRVNGVVYKANDDYEGREPNKALRTISRAWALCTASAGDTIVLLPGAHSISSSIAASVAGVSMVGMNSGLTNWLSPRVSITITATDEIVNVTAADIKIQGIKFIPITAAKAIDFSSAAHRFQISECSFDMNTPAVSTSTIGIAALGAAANVLIDRCYFFSDGAQGLAIDATATLDSTIQNCVFILISGTWAKIIGVGAATDRLVVRDCDFLAGGTSTFTGAIEGAAATIDSGVSVFRCYFPDQTGEALLNFPAGKAEIAECYISGIGGGDGGVLLTDIGT